MESKTRFIIQVNETYYVTTGPLLAYDPAEAKTDEHRAAYVDIANRFKTVREECEHVYKAVKLVDDSFCAISFAEEK